MGRNDEMDDIRSGADYHEDYRKSLVDYRDNYKDDSEQFAQALQKDCFHEALRRSDLGMREKIKRERSKEDFHEREVDYHKDCQKECYEEGYRNQDINFLENFRKDRSDEAFRHHDQAACEARHNDLVESDEGCHRGCAGHFGGGYNGGCGGGCGACGIHNGCCD